MKITQEKSKAIPIIITITLCILASISFIYIGYKVMNPKVTPYCLVTFDKDTKLYQLTQVVDWGSDKNFYETKQPQLLSEQIKNRGCIVDTKVFGAETTTTSAYDRIRDEQDRRMERLRK